MFLSTNTMKTPNDDLWISSKFPHLSLAFSPKPICSKDINL